ncbi:MAG: FkbM family methyltransferase [Hyphomonadaceae bacterium]|nr:FkbM family methyltransferase [Hyphomonadaceae bacterium]
MMQLSYAQNLEDYHLDLVFADGRVGTYVDVGGGHPVADNVSFWFYLKGWRGLIVEPQETLAGIYAHVRPRDRTVSCLAGRSEGEAEFHVVAKLHGFSTTVRQHAAGASQFGADFATVKKPVRPLAALCAEAGLTDIDFLKIDVEGAEAEAIAGMDFRRWRPRVVVVEAVAPGSMEASWQAWEPALLAAGYAFAFFDRLNRFYVAHEAAELAARFPREPTPWDRVQHLWDAGRAVERTEHPDHVLAKTLQAGFFAALPSLGPALLAELVDRGLEATKAGAFGPAVVPSLIGTGEQPRPPAASGDLAQLLDTDALRAALGRIACMYDGGHIVE